MKNSMVPSCDVSQRHDNIYILGEIEQKMVEQDQDITVCPLRKLGPHILRRQP